MVELPTGTVTFLFTDLEGSTRLWEEHPDAMQSALARHDEILRDAVAAHDGHVVKTTGDGVHAAFADAASAVYAARDAQLALAAEPWEGIETLRVRMGLHTGPAEQRAGDYYGTAVNRAARLMNAAHGGQIVVSLATEELLRDTEGADIELIDLGEHRLRDLSRPERVFQVAAPGLARDVPPLRSLDAFAGNLPAQVTSFVGRDAEIVAVAHALRDARLVTITGVGGVGKTRLAVQVAAEVLPRYPDGAWFCELAAAEDGETMLQVVASSLDVAPRPDMSFEASILDFLRTKHLLVLLDNCEHLLEPAGRLISSILRDCRNVEVLATSREVLSVPGEHVVGLRSMAVPDVSDSPDAVGASEAVQLFLERARAVRAGFDVDVSNAGSVAEVCRRLDGIPLAIELAAARVAAMSPAEIASLLDERFRLLRGGRRTALERHQTLRATVDWSYSLLDANERAVFDRLGVFAGVFDAVDARAVVSGDGIEAWDVLDAVASLVAKSMVIADEDASGTTRYQMLETIRAYARERLDEAHESDAWRRRPAERYAAFAEDACPALQGPDELAWRRNLRSELDNVRAAVFWALDSDAPGDHELALRIVANLAAEVTLDRAADFGPWAERALPYVEETTLGLRAAVLGTAAFNAFHRGDLDAARVLASEAVRDGVPVDCPNPAIVYVALSAIDNSAGRHTEAVTILNDALRDSAAIEENLYFRANLLAVRAFFGGIAGDGAQARQDAEASLTLSRRLGNPSQTVIALTALGTTLVDDDPGRARTALEEGLALTRIGASDVNLSIASTQLARLRMRDGEVAGALDSLRTAVTHGHADGDRPGLAGSLLTVAEIMAALGRHEAVVVLNRGVVDGELRPLAAGMSITLSQQSDLLVHARDLLGNDRYEAAAARGAGLSYEAIVAYALAEIATAETELEGAHV